MNELEGLQSYYPIEYETKPGAEFGFDYGLIRLELPNERKLKIYHLKYSFEDLNIQIGENICVIGYPKEYGYPKEECFDPC